MGRRKTPRLHARGRRKLHEFTRKTPGKGGLIREEDGCDSKYPHIRGGARRFGRLRNEERGRRHVGFGQQYDF